MKKFVAILLGATLALSACGTPPTKQEQRYPEPPTLSCKDGLMEYSVVDTPMQFCYDPAWGDVVISEVPATVGKGTKVSFSGDVPSPSVQYQTYNFDGEGEEFCFSCYDINAPEAAIKAAVTEKLGFEPASVRKSEVFGIRAIRINDAGTLSYYVPGAFDGNNLMISGPSEFAEGLDDFIWDFVIYEQ